MLVSGHDIVAISNEWGVSVGWSWPFRETISAIIFNFLSRNSIIFVGIKGQCKEIRAYRTVLCENNFSINERLRDMYAKFLLKLSFFHEISSWRKCFKVKFWPILGGGGRGGELLGWHAGGLGLSGALLPWRLYQEGFGRRMRNVAASLSAGIANRQYRLCWC